MLIEMMQLYPTTATLIIAVFSLCIGSLLNVVIYRLPVMLKSNWTRECQLFLNLSEQPRHKSINLFFPRSHCPHCQETIPFWHNIPLLSYLILRGKSKCCNQRISLRYPAVEMLTLSLSLICIWTFGLNDQLLFSLVFVYLIIIIAFIDLEHQLIPDSLSLGLLWIGLIANSMMLFTNLPDAVLSAAGAYLFLWIIMQGYYLITGKIGMGHGDFKLFAAFGAWFGWVQLPFILLLSSIIGSVIGIIYLKASKYDRNTPIPFGPFLCLGGITSLYFGSEILYWYIGLW